MFHETQEAGYCGLHCIRNLLRNKVITKKELDSCAKECAKLSGDSLSNHMTTHGFWSIETLLTCLHAYHFKTKRAFFNGKWNLGELETILKDPRAMGFIIHDKYHYTCIRKNQYGTGWEYSNSANAGPIPIQTNQILRTKCTVFYVGL